MKHHITIYELANGLIVSDTAVHEGRESELMLAGWGWVPGQFGGDEFRIDLATLAAVPLFEFEEVVTDNTVSNLPLGKEVTCLFYGLKEVVTDGDLNIIVGDVEDIQVLLMCDLYKPKEVTVHCVPS